MFYLYSENDIPGVKRGSRWGSKRGYRRGPEWGPDWGGPCFCTDPCMGQLVYNIQRIVLFTVNFVHLHYNKI